MVRQVRFQRRVPAPQGGNPANDPKSQYVGDIVVPWNIGQTVFRYKAPRDVKISEASISVKEILSPTGAPVVVEAWKNGTYSGTVNLSNGATVFPPISLKRLDEIELKILVKGEHESETKVCDLWFLYCVS